MINLYKRYVFWTLRVMGHIPGLKRCSSFMTRQYTKRFWTMVVFNMTASWAIHFGGKALQRHLEAKLAQEQRRFGEVDLSALEKDIKRWTADALK